MRVAPLPADEDARLAALAEYELGETADDPAFGHLVTLAARLFDVPSAFVSLIERDRQIFFSKVGIDACQTDRGVSFCSHTVARDDMFVVLDTHLDVRFHDNPLVTGDPFIRFYAGFPLRSPSGHPIGSLCIIDRKPRNGFSETDALNLRDIAKLVIDLLEMRRLDVARRISQSRFESIAATSPDGIICADQHGNISVWNEAAVRIFGHTVEEAIGQTLEIIVPTRMRGGHNGGMRRLIEGGAPRLIGKTIELPAQHKDGTEFPIELSLSMWSEDGQVAFGSIVRDIRERRANEERLFRLAHHDPLTALPNRTVLCERITEGIAARDALAVMMVDLDGFKEVNDTMGHSAGDRLLRLTAERLLACVAPTDTVARLGGDEFAIVLNDVADDGRVALVADAIVSAICRPFMIEEQVLNLSASVGVTRATTSFETAEELLSNADLALYQAKADGRHCFRVFTPDLRMSAVSRRAGREDLHRATENGEFVLFYQPQVRLSDGAMVGAEALIRWQHPDRGLLTPAAFLSALENSRYAAEVGDWVLRTACMQAAQWRLHAPMFRIGVNLFGAQCRTGDLSAKVFAALTAAHLPVSALEIEITENIILHQDDAQLNMFRALHEAGIGIAFDDYGTGYASLSQLKAFPLTRLKIDQSFVRGMCDSAQDAAIIKAVLDLSRSFNLDVIAEGVETDEQQRRLLAKGCTEAQGYLFARPLPTAEFATKYGLFDAKPEPKWAIG